MVVLWVVVMVDVGLVSNVVASKCRLYLWVVGLLMEKMKNSYDLMLK